MAVLRGFAIIFVVSIHTFGGATFRAETYLCKLICGMITSISQSGVPIFIFISGYLLYLRNKNDFSVVNFYKARFGRILPPYIFVAYIYSVLFHDFSLESFTFKLFTFNIHFHFGFIGLICSFYLFFPLLLTLFKKFNPYIFLFGSFAFQLIWIILLELPLVKLNYYFYPIISFPSHIFFFTLGMFFVKKKEKIFLISKYRIVLAILTLLLLINAFINLNFISLGPKYELRIFGLSIIAILLLYRLSYRIKNNKFLKFIASYSYGIYLFHLLFERFFVFTYFYLPGMIYYFLLFLVCLFGSFLTTYVFNLVFTDFF